MPAGAYLLSIFFGIDWFLSTVPEEGYQEQEREALSFKGRSLEERSLRATLPYPRSRRKGLIHKRDLICLSLLCPCPAPSSIL